MRDVFNGYSTPCYVVYEDRFQRNLKDILGNFKKFWKNNVICGYSCKTNNSKNMITLAKKFGMYAEVVSTREYELVKELGYQDKQIIFNGPNKGKTAVEACRNGALVNVDNLCELEKLTESFLRQYGSYPEKLGLRINFDLESYVPGQTSTGEEAGRFGICYENGDVDRAISFLREKDIRLSGLHIHYTTKTRSLEVYAAIAALLAEIIEAYGLRLDYIDIGGGFWGGRRLEGKPTMEQYAEVISRTLAIDEPPTLILEPGSALCSTVAEYWTEVLSVKDIRDTRFVLLDGCSLHINPFQVERNAQCSLYSKNECKDRARIGRQVLCGSTCLEKDRLSDLRNEGCLEAGDRVIFENVGAYTSSLVSDFILDRPNEYIEWSGKNE